MARYIAIGGGSEFANGELAIDAHRPHGEAGFGRRHHLHQDAVVQHGARPEAALHVVAHQHELLDAVLLKAGQDIAADVDPLAVERFDLVGKLRRVVRIALLHVELDVVEGDFIDAAAAARSFDRGGRDAQADEHHSQDEDCAASGHHSK